MKLLGKNPWAPWAIFIVCGVSLALILAFLSGVIFAKGLQYEYVQIIDLLIGIFIIGGFGLVLVEKSRYIGALIIALYIPALLYFSYTNRVIYDSLFLGIALGIIITSYFIYKIKFDWLARTLKYLIDIFMIIFIGYLIFMIIQNYSQISKNGTLIYFIIAILLSIGLYIFLSKNLYAVTSSDVLIIGPSSSGKSYVIAALAVNLVREYQATANSYIFSKDPDAGNRLAIANIANKYQNGYQNGKGILESTSMNEMAYYQFTGRRWGIIPLTVTCLDYAGGLFAAHKFEKIEEQNYENQVQLIAQIMGRTPTEVSRDFGNIEFFWNDFYQQFRNDFYTNFDDIVPAFIYARLLKAGKIIFLIDGQKIQSQTATDPDWENYLTNINRLIASLGENKDYAFAITKADLIPDIKNIIRGEVTQTGVTVPGVSENSEKAREIEKSKIEFIFSENYFLKNIYNTIMKNSFIRLQYIEGYLISVDCSPRITDDVTGYHPWRLKEVARYIMKF
jgi:ABC-type dipeptide/oligopeptide/nickel transport system ATPase component